MEPLTLPLISFLPGPSRTDAASPASELLAFGDGQLGGIYIGDDFAPRRQESCPQATSYNQRYYHSRSSGQLEFDSGTATDFSVSRQQYPHDRQSGYQHQFQYGYQQRREHRMQPPREEACIALKRMEGITAPVDRQLAHISLYRQKSLEQCSAFQPRRGGAPQPMEQGHVVESPPHMLRNSQPPLYTSSRIPQVQSPFPLVERRRMNRHKRSTSAPFQLPGDELCSATWAASDSPAFPFPPSPSWEADVSYYRRTNARYLANTLTTSTAGCSNRSRSNYSASGGYAGSCPNIPMPVTASMHLPLETEPGSTASISSTGDGCPCVLPPEITSIPLLATTIAATSTTATAIDTSTTIGCTCSSCPSIPLPASSRPSRSRTMPVAALHSRHPAPHFDPYSLCLTQRAITLPPLSPERPATLPTLNPETHVSLPPRYNEGAISQKPTQLPSWWPMHSPPAASSAAASAAEHKEGVGMMPTGRGVGERGGGGYRVFSPSPPPRHHRTVSAGRLRRQRSEILPAAQYAMDGARVGVLTGITQRHAVMDGSSDEYDLG